MEQKNSCYTYFRITGTFEPDEMTKMLNLQPFNTFKTGQLRRDGKSRYDFSCWSFGKCDIYDVEVDKQMITTITPLLDKIDILNDLRKKYDLYFCLEVVPTINPDETTPVLSPSLEVMQFCCDTGTGIDIDMYFC